MPVNPLLVTSFTLTVLVDILAPLLLAVFLVSQGITRIPAMIYFQTRPAVQAALAEPVWFWLFLFFAACTAGLFEEGGRWLAFRFAIPPAERHWRTALMLGAGHGGLESIGIGLLTLAGLVAYVVITILPPETFGGYAAQVAEGRKQFAALQGWEPLLGGWERLGALTIQVALAVLVLQAFLRGRRWWWYAVAAHTLVDFTTVAVLSLVAKAWGRVAAMLVVEGLVTVYALLAFWLIVTLRSGEQEAVVPGPGDLTATLRSPAHGDDTAGAAAGGQGEDTSHP
jgi:uncharacterized membrane protein YhfC